MSLNVFVPGLDDLNLRVLQESPDAARYRFHPLLSLAELKSDDLDFDRLVAHAEAELSAFDGPIDAIIGFWDFPVTSLVSLLCARHGLHGASLEAVAKCEHKYWSRLEQREVIDEYPAFGLVDLADDPVRPPPGVRYPLWLKPVKSMSSALAFLVRDRAEFDGAVTEIRAGIDTVGRPFEAVLARLDLPPRVAAAGGAACLAEESIDGAQVTVEGCVFAGEARVYGVVDSLRYPGRPSFLRYQYPSSLPAAVTGRMADISTRVIERIGLDFTTFNIEYFWDRENDAINLLEVNPRHSQSHALLFGLVDGVPNHRYMTRLALGLDPEIDDRGGGRHAVAAKWFVRRFTDGVVRRTPSAEEIAAVEREIPDTVVRVLVKPGQRLSELRRQDSYSYQLAHVHMGARDEAELEARYERCLAGLPFEFDE